MKSLLPVVPGVILAAASVALTSVLLPVMVMDVVPELATVAVPLAVALTGDPAGDVMVAVMLSPFTNCPPGMYVEPRPRFDAVLTVAVLALLAVNFRL